MKDIENSSEKRCEQKQPCHLFVIAYRAALKSELGKDFYGVAVVKACDVHQAEAVFLNETQLNAYKGKLKIGKLEQIPENSIEPMLLAEEWV